MKHLALLLVITFINTTVSAQELADPPQDYKAAVQLVNNAVSALKSGDVIISDSLIHQSMKLYPTVELFEYVKEICRLPDMNQAWNLMDELYEAVQFFPANEIVMLESNPSSIKKNRYIKRHRHFDKSHALIIVGNESYLINKEFGKYQWTIRLLEKLVQINIKEIVYDDVKKRKWYGKLDYEYALWESYPLHLAQSKKEYDKAISITEKPYTDPMVRKHGLLGIYFEKGDLDKALQIAESFSEDDSFSKYLWRFKIHAVKGNIPEALDNYAKCKQEFATKTNSDFYYLGLIDLQKARYDEALVNFDQALHYRITGGDAYMASQMLLDTWIVHKSIGDAFSGLQQYEKAKDNYNIALLANPDYDAAIAALANLETTIATETSIDKNAPTISLLEPAPTRGFKVKSAGANVLIKGIAPDLSGLKEVKINNKIVYAQKGGDFWGEVPLVEGMNKLTITATDFAGNKGEQVFEIERQIAKATEIIPVEVKEGRNYCVLIAAQNYSDNNIPSLTNPVADAVKLKLIFKNNYNFAEENIITLFNPELNDVKRQLLELTNMLQPEDNLVIFYAGHGIWVDKEKKGYWLLTDSKRNDVNTWLPNKTVLDLIAKVPSRHTLLITDACFSGSVFKTRGLGKDAPAAMKEMDEKISRVAITSGNDTEVPDESVFMKYLVKALSENKEKYLTAQKMFINQIIEAVMTETKTEPRYGTLELAGHVGGDFIFIKK